MRVVWWAAAALLIGYTGLSLERKITWYLAVDQFGYLTFAHDLLSGHVFHHWAPLDAIKAALPERTDVLAQTYIYDRGRLYCRYAPGFPMILAAWLALFGDNGANLLNPTLFLALLVLLIAFQQRALRSPWRALAGVALLVLFPTLMHLWALTLTRDLAAHLTAFTGLFLMLPFGGRRLAPRRVALAGLALGFAASIRPDALLYGLPATAVAATRWRHEGTSFHLRPDGARRRARRHDRPRTTSRLQHGREREPVHSDTGNGGQAVPLTQRTVESGRAGGRR